MELSGDLTDLFVKQPLHQRMDILVGFIGVIELGKPGSHTIEPFEKRDSLVGL